MMADSAETKAVATETMADGAETKAVATETMADGAETKAVATEVTELEKKIIKQVEYYFGDINLGRDKFLREEITKDDGWVTLETMLNFNRLKSLTDDTNIIASALKKSELMEVSEDNTKIRRSLSKPLSEPTKDDLMLRTVYAKGFPIDTTLDQAMEFFEKFGRTDNVYLRRDMMRKCFKGSCFVVYADKEGAKNFLETPDVKYGETEMIRLLKDDYFKSKNTVKKQKTDEKVKKSEEEKQQKETEEKEKMKEKLTPGAILSIEGIPKDARRDDIKNFFLKFGTVEWVDLEMGDSKSRVRFGAKDLAKEALEKAKEENEGKIMIKGVEVQCHVLEGDEELEHWVNIFKAKMNSNKERKFDPKKRRRGGFDRRGGPQRKRARYAGGKNDSDGDDDE